MKSTEITTILFKQEVTPGVDPVPTTGANGVLAFDVRMKPMEGQEATRKRSTAFFSAPQQFPTKLFQELSFETDLVGHATRGTAPAWSALAKAAGLAEVATPGTSVVYNPVSTGIPSATIYVNFDGVQHKLRYARGDCMLKLSAHGLPRMAWRFLGLYEEPTDVAAVQPTLTTWADPQVVNYVNTPTFTINGYAAKMSAFELAFNSNLFLRELVNAQSVEISGREPLISTTIEAEPMATFNPFLLARQQTAFAVNLVHGTGSGRIVTVNAPNCRLNRPEGPGEEDKLINWPLKIVPLPTASNDDFTITLT
jgi:hypothetical protein